VKNLSCWVAALPKPRCSRTEMPCFCLSISIVSLILVISFCKLLSTPNLISLESTSSLLTGASETLAVKSRIWRLSWSFSERNYASSFWYLTSISAKDLTWLLFSSSNLLFCSVRVFSLAIAFARLSLKRSFSALSLTRFPSLSAFSPLRFLFSAIKFWLTSAELAKDCFSCSFSARRFTFSLSMVSFSAFIFRLIAFSTAS